MVRPVVELLRLEEDHDHGTFGVLRIGKEIVCWTLEESDELNAPNESSIPAQQYRCRRIISPKFGETYQVMDVPDRFNILFHPGNTDDDTEGCIMLGETIGKLRGQRAILNSGATFRRFMAMLEGHDEFHLTIKEHY